MDDKSESKSESEFVNPICQQAESDKYFNVKMVLMSNRSYKLNFKPNNYSF